MKQIKELKLDFEPDRLNSEDQLSDAIVTEEPEYDTLFSVLRPSSMETILQYLPPRPIADRRLATYFNTKFLILRM